MVYLFLVQLDRPFNATAAVQAVEYLRAGGTNPDTDAEVETAGWGSLDNLGSRPDKLKEVVLEIVSWQRCRRSDYFGRKFTSNMMCAHKVCPDPCDKPLKKEDTCDVSLGSFSSTDYQCCCFFKWDRQHEVMMTIS